MVVGLSKFVEHLKGFEDCFVLIGGTACDLWMESVGLQFRATRDLDVVLISESLGPDFQRLFWDFIELGRYREQSRSSHTPPFYRFVQPDSDGFPAMIELFSNEFLELPDSAVLTPIPAGDELISLSAILLDDESYQYLLGSKIDIDGIPTVPGSTLIPLKAAAWSDLKRRQKAGEPVKSRDIKKHRNDVFLLYLSLKPGDRYALPDTLQAPFHELLQALPPDSPDWNAIRASIRSQGLELPDPATVLQTVGEIFEVPEF
ncbi:MAG: hypothetical protein ACC655_03320 [Rhodothermia bacterium]